MGLAHDSDDSDTRGGPDGLRTQLGQQDRFEIWRDGGNDVDQSGQL